MRTFNLSLIASVATLAVMFGPQAYAMERCPQNPRDLVKGVEMIGMEWQDYVRKEVNPNRQEPLPTDEAVKMIADWRKKSLMVLRCVDENRRDKKPILDTVEVLRGMVKTLGVEAHRCIPSTPAMKESCDNLAKIGLQAMDGGSSEGNSIEVWSMEPDPEDDIHLVIVISAPPEDD